MGSYYLIISRNYITGLYYRIILHDCITGLYYGIQLQDYVTESYYGIILWSHITERSWNCLRTRRYEKDPGGAQDVPGSPWDLRGPRRHAQRTLPGTPLGPLGDPRAPTAHKTQISRQIYSATSSRFLCSNLLVGTHGPKDSTGLFCL